MDQDSRESAATTMIHRKTQRIWKSKKQNTEKMNEYVREFHTSHAECPLLIRNGRPRGGGDYIYIYKK